MNRLRVLLLTLPIPEPPCEIQRGNHQLFALFFKNFLRLRGEERFEILTLPRRVVDLGTNGAVVDAILERGPDVAGFSLYLWNIERSIECARMLKQADGRLIAVGGGPEVQEDNGFLLGRPAFDFLVRGEGEDAFLALLDFLQERGCRSRKVAGLSLEGAARNGRLMELPSLFVGWGIQKEGGELPAGRRNGVGSAADGEAGGTCYVPTTRQGSPLAVEAVQRGITDLYDEHKADDFAYLELVRGCPYSCDFCSYAKNRKDVSRLPVPLALESIRVLLERNVGEIYLLAPTINCDRRYFRALLDGIAEARREFPGCRTTFFSELRIELLAEGDVDDMIGAGFHEFEIGLQTLREERLLDRAADLLARGAKPVVDFILGLPGEDYAGCIRTVEALDRKGLLPCAVFYHLLVLPGSALRKTALERGYRFSPQPPYHMLRTDRMDLEDIRTVYLYLEHKKNHSYFAEPLYTEPGVVRTIRRAGDTEALRDSRSLKTGCLVAPETPAELGVIVDRLGAYVREAPEVFHRAFVLWDFGSRESSSFGKKEPPGSPPDIPPEGVQSLLDGMSTLLEIFREAGNYFDRYCASLDYLDRESFSKRATVLINPFSGEADRARELLEDGGFDYAYGVRAGALTAIGGGEARSRLALLEREWSERGVYTVFLDGRAGPANSAGGTREAGARPYLERELGRPPGDEEGFLYYVLHIAEG
jgi:radical SAM superfamily enzyme YgiQ (UPF0313 family)